MALNPVELGFEYFPDPTKGSPVYFGSIYVGEPDLDPQIPANQKTIQYRQEDGTLVPATQPVATSAGGVPLYNGSPVQIIVDGAYSIKVLNSSGSQVYYRADSSDNESDAIVPLDVIADLQANTDDSIDRVSLAGHTTEGDGGGGDFWFDTSDISTADDNGINIVDAQSPRTGTWKRIYSGKVNVKWFGAVGDGVANDKAAIEAAWAVSHNIMFPTAGPYYAPLLELDGGGSDYTNKSISGNSTEITGDDFFIYNMFGCQMENMTFSPTGATYLGGVRYCDWHNVIFNDNIKWGKWNVTFTQSSWSTYWNNFTQCKFNGIEAQTALTDANFNSNNFNACEFRSGDKSALWTFTQTATNDPVFVGNTFNSCDMSYDPVLDITIPISLFSMTVIGGYLDTGTTWYAPGSNKVDGLNVVGIRNPSGEQIENRITSGLLLTTGGARPKNRLPVGGVSYWKTKPKTVGAFVVRATSVLLPYTGEYTISAHITINAGNLDAATFTNNTSAVSVSGALLEGYSSYTFTAAAGDEVEIAFDGDGSADIDIDFLALTSGAGTYEMLEKKDVIGTESTGTAANAVAENLLTIDIGANANKFQRIVLFTRAQSSSGGGEKIVLDVAIATGASTVAVTVDEVSRASVDGVGGTSDDSGTFAISTSTSVTAVTVVGTLSGNPANIDWKLYEKSLDGV